MAGRELFHFPSRHFPIAKSLQFKLVSNFQESAAEAAGDMLPEDRLVICCSKRTKRHVWKLALCRHRPCFLTLLALLRTDTLQKSHCTPTVLDRLKYVYSIYILTFTYVYMYVSLMYKLNTRICTCVYIYIQYIYIYNIYIYNIYTYAPVTYIMYSTRLVF